MKDNYTKEEQEILEALEEDRVSLVNPSPEELAEVRKAASESLKKSKRITIRLYKHDYIAIQEKASEMGSTGREAVYPRFAAQTLIANVERLYAELLRQKNINLHQQGLPDRLKRHTKGDLAS